jgi:hypothetical protein
MESLLLSAHVVVGILFVGPVAMTTTLFPRFARASDGGDDQGSSPPRVAVALHRATKLYGALALAVPVIGILLAVVQGRMAEIWITAAMILTAVAGALLALRIVPAQRDVLHAAVAGQGLRTLTIWSAVFNVIWAAVVVLMIVRPGAA